MNELSAVIDRLAEVMDMPDDVKRYAIAGADIIYDVGVDFDPDSDDLVTWKKIMQDTKVAEKEITSMATYLMLWMKFAEVSHMIPGMSNHVRVVASTIPTALLYAHRSGYEEGYQHGYESAQPSAFDDVVGDLFDD